MKIIDAGSQWVIYVGAALLVSVIFVTIHFGLKASGNEAVFVYGFLFGAWPIQWMNSWLFAVGLLYLSRRYAMFKREEELFRKVQLPESSIVRDRVLPLIKGIPQEYAATLAFRRFREILQAFIYGEDVIRLNEELSRRDITEVERGHLILNSLRSLIPVMGFLGTVWGLSLGMTRFPEIGDVGQLRDALKDFSLSLSVAFNTTLLALGYTVIIILLASFLKQREELLVTQLDERARLLIGKMRVAPQINTPEPGVRPLDRWPEDLPALLRDLAAQNGHLAQAAEKAIRETGQALLEKLEQIKDEVQRPPRYQVIVKPLPGQPDDAG